MNNQQITEEARKFQAQQIYEQRAREQQMREEQKTMYAGFWKRFAAILIDIVILAVVSSTFAFLLALIDKTAGSTADSLYSASSMDLSRQTAEASKFSYVTAFTPFFVQIVFPWLYFSLFERSKLQATPGKLALGIVVVNANYQPLHFGRATGRHFSKFFSSLLFCIGYMMAGWTANKQALHDMIASTYVVNKKSLPLLQQQRQ